MKGVPLTAPESVSFGVYLDMALSLLMALISRWNYDVMIFLETFSYTPWDDPWRSASATRDCRFSAWGCRSEVVILLWNMHSIQVKCYRIEWNRQLFSYCRWTIIWNKERDAFLSLHFCESRISLDLAILFKLSFFLSQFCANYP